MKIADELLGTEGMCQLANLMSQREEEPPSKPLRNDTSLSKVIRFEGLYQNPGYASSIDLCDTLSVTPYCTKVRQTFETVDSWTGRRTHSGQLVARPPGNDLQHLRLEPIEDPGYEYTYALEGGFLFPEGYGKDKTPFAMMSGGAYGKFVVEDGEVLGFGLFGTVDGVEETPRQRWGKTIEEQADVWFTKM
jgi:hypothetical protein